MKGNVDKMNKVARNPKTSASQLRGSMPKGPNPANSPKHGFSRAGMKVKAKITGTNA